MYLLRYVVLHSFNKSAGLSELGSATIDKFAAYLCLGTNIILIQVENLTDLYNKVCY